MRDRWGIRTPMFFEAYSKQIDGAANQVEKD